MTSAARLTRMLKVLSVGTRVQMIQLLKHGPLCVGALAAQLDVTQGAVSQHLRVLREVGIVVANRRGLFVHYGLNEKALGNWKAAINHLLEPGRPQQSCGCKRRKP